MTCNYQEEYTKLITFLSQDKTPWELAEQTPPPEDGTHIYFMCGKDYKGDTLYDIGAYEDYTKEWWYCEGDLEGEFSTSFGNCMEIVAWKLAKEYYK